MAENPRTSYISNHLNAAVLTLRFYPFRFTRVEFMNISFNQSIAFIIPALTTFLQLKYQGINDHNGSTPFQTHPATMLVAVSSSVAYYLAYAALLRFPPRRVAAVARHCSVWAGYASVASLASVLFPDCCRLFVYAVFGSLSASELAYWLYRKLVAEEDGAEFRFHMRRFLRFLNNVCGGLGNSSGRLPQILPT